MRLSQNVVVGEFQSSWKKQSNRNHKTRLCYHVGSSRVKGKDFFWVVLFLLLGQGSQKVYNYCRESKHQGLLCMNMCGFPPEPNGAVENFQRYAEPTCEHLWDKSGYLRRNDGAKTWRLSWPLVKHPHGVHKRTVTPYPSALSWSLLIFLNNSHFVIS